MLWKLLLSLFWRRSIKCARWELYGTIPTTFQLNEQRCTMCWKKIVAYFCAVTALEKQKKKKKKPPLERNVGNSSEMNNCSSDSENDMPEQSEMKKFGLSFWIVFDSPDISLCAFESDITKLFLSAGLDIKDCKAIKCRCKHFSFSYLH